MPEISAESLYGAVIIGDVEMRGRGPQVLEIPLQGVIGFEEHTATLCVGTHPTRRKELRIWVEVQGDDYELEW